MLQILYYLFYFLINIGTFTIISISSGFFLLIFTHYEKGQSLLGIGMTLLLIIGVLPTARWMVTYLENYYPAVKKLPDDIKGIIILGGSFDRPLSVQRNTDIFNSAAGRFIAGLKLAREYPHLNVLFTGGGVAVDGAATEAEIAKTYFQAFGIEESRVIYEDQSMNTEENASKSFELIKPGNERWALITSALHMPRSAGLFQAKGWTILPCPVDYRTGGSYSFRHLPNLEYNFLLWHEAFKEWAGMLSNWLRSLTPSFLPGRNL